MTDIEQAGQEVQEYLDTEIVAWRPEPGDAVVGVLRGLEHRTNEWSTNYPLLTIAPLSGATPWLGVHAFHTVLWKHVEDAAPQIGDVVGVKYLGRQGVGGSSNEYEGYKFTLRRTGSSGNGAAHEGASTPEPEATGWSPESTMRAPAAPGTDSDENVVAGVAQWQALLAQCDGSEQAATNRINLANRTNYTKETARAGASWAEVQKALST